jgi:hypothetical protein
MFSRASFPTNAAPYQPPPLGGLIEARSDSKKTAASPISSAVPQRPMQFCSPATLSTSPPTTKDKVALARMPWRPYFAAIKQ